jgi:hypothetical protein
MPSTILLTIEGLVSLLLCMMYEVGGDFLRVFNDGVVLKYCFYHLTNIWLETGDTVRTEYREGGKSVIGNDSEVGNNQLWFFFTLVSPTAEN